MNQSEIKSLMTVLELSSYPFTLEELTSAWRKASRKWHPDLPGGNVELMKRVNVAHIALKPLVVTVKPIEKKPEVLKKAIPNRNIEKTNNFMKQMQRLTIKTLQKRYAAGDENAGRVLRFWED